MTKEARKAKSNFYENLFRLTTDNKVFRKILNAERGKKPKGFSNPKEILDQTDGLVHKDSIKIANSSFDRYFTEISQTLASAFNDSPLIPEAPLSKSTHVNFIFEPVDISITMSNLMAVNQQKAIE